MYIFQVIVILFIRISTSFKQLDITLKSDNRRAIIIDRCNGLVSIYTKHSSLLNAFLSSRIYREQFTRKYFPNVSSKDIITKVNSLNNTSVNKILLLSLYNNLANKVYTYIIRKDINN